ncbi:protein walls are thin 1 [Quercus suber]|uniref:WAT1-related protein n=1 Tax=Quercus suber TaxID=58331 RepID=A0AAW0LJB5_QUESU
MAEAGSAFANRMGVPVPERTKLHLAMIVCQLGYAGNHIIMKTALNMGISMLVLPVYRNIVALVALVPFAYFLEKRNRPPVSASLLLQFFFLGLIGMEQVHLNRKDGIAKVLGTVSSVAGSLVITLYKGPTLFGSNLRWMVLQTPVLKKYPARLSITSYTYFFSIFQFLVIAALFEKDSQVWLVHSTDEIFTIFYTGLVASAMTYAIQMYVIDKAGPVFVSVYLPLQTMLVAIIEAVALGEKFYLGGIIGAVLIVAGLYLVVWGKSEERKFDEEKPSVSENSNGESSSNASLTQPLLPTSST